MASAYAPSTSCAIRRVLYAALCSGMLDCPMPRLSNVQQVTSGRPAASRRPARCATTGCRMKVAGREYSTALGTAGCMCSAQTRSQCRRALSCTYKVTSETSSHWIPCITK